MKQITQEQRYQIQAFIKAGQSKAFIALQLGIHRSNIYRELNRNSRKHGGYNASHAQMLCQERKERLRRKRSFDVSKEKFICKYIEEEQWSPEQIVGYCKKELIPMVSHERIYQYIRSNKQQGGSLYKHLRHCLKHRKRPVNTKQIPIKNRVSIDQRPEIIGQKGRFGDWEIDTIIGKNGKGAIVTMVERTTAFFMMKKLPQGKNAQSLANHVIDMLLPYKSYVHSITSDNGTEFAEHQKIAQKLKTEFFFANPYSSWERGLNEYTNKLIRQYIPKKSNFNSYDNEYIAEIQHKINRRPRKRNMFRAPKEVFFNLVA